jgi:hypothetical protein
VFGMPAGETVGASGFGADADDAPVLTRSVMGPVSGDCERFNASLERSMK